MGELEQVSRLVEDGLMPSEGEALGLSGQHAGDGRRGSRPPDPNPNWCIFSVIGEGSEGPWIL